MKKSFLFLMATAAILTSCGGSSKAPQVEPAIPQDPQIEKNIQEWLKKMTLDEKVGQMLELNLDLMGSVQIQGEAKIDRKKLKEVLSQFGNNTQEQIAEVMAMSDEEVQAKLGGFGLDIYDSNTVREWTLNEAALDSMIGKWKVGSILNAPGHALSVEHWQKVITKIQEKSMEYIGIPCIYGLDNNHGTTYVAGGTLFPQNINVAASFNTDLAYTSSEICAYESRTANCPWVYNPTIDLGRDPRWSRIWESYGEDAIVTSRMVEAAVRGYQGPDNNHIDGKHVATSV